jgi:DNA-binding NtrC family response regulator
MTVVICERDLPDGDWHDIWEGIAPLAPHPTLIVTSLHADEHLWAEVLNLGGYDVLAKPFDAQEVCRIVGRAWERVRATAHRVEAA